MNIRAKFSVNRVEAHNYGNGFVANKVFFTPQYDPDSPEDQRFQKATPSGELWMQIDNPAAIAEFVPGRAYYLNFTPVEQ